jgi:hypothetical protein
MSLIKFIGAHNFKIYSLNTNLDIINILLTDGLLLQCSCTSGMLSLHKILQRHIKTRTFLRHTKNNQASRRNWSTDAKRLILCVLLWTHRGAAYFPVNSVTSITLGIVHKYHSTGVCWLQSSKSEG